MLIYKLDLIIKHATTVKIKTIITKTQVQLFTLRRMALAFALIIQMLKYENSSNKACDFGSELCIISLAMTCTRKFDASLPQAP